MYVRIAHARPLAQKRVNTIEDVCAHEMSVRVYGVAGSSSDGGPHLCIQSRNSDGLCVISLPHGLTFHFSMFYLLSNRFMHRTQSIAWHVCCHVGRPFNQFPPYMWRCMVSASARAADCGFSCSPLVRPWTVQGHRHQEVQQVQMA